jgi:uncharacterized lipoprotein YajG
MKKLVILLQLFAVMLLTACSNGEHVADLKSPIEVVSYNNGPKVCIADVTDNRLFVGNENQPNLPSGEILSPDYKSRAYARLKNTFGSQTGAMLLPRDKTVTMVVKEILERALSDDGYTVVQDAAAEDPDTMIMAVSIKQFWTWAGLEKINDNIYSDIELDVYTQNQGAQKHFNLKNRQTRKVLTDTRTLYKTTTEQSLANIYNLAVEKFKNLQ